jgi:hypothetical protein
MNRNSDHAPLNPSQLREVYVPSEGSASPDTAMHSGGQPQSNRGNGEGSSSAHTLGFSTDGIQPAPDHASVHSNGDDTRGALEYDSEPTVRTRLLNQQNWDAGSCCGSESCNHGALSPRPWSVRSYGTVNSSSSPGFGGLYPGGSGPTGGSTDPTHALLGDAVADGLLGVGSGPKKSTTMYLAERHGIRHKRMM